MRYLKIVLSLALTVACSRPPESPVAPGGQKRLTFSILEDYDKGQDLDDARRDFELFAELGITTWRGSFGWDDYEPARGRYDFDWLHRFAELAAAHHITLRPYIGYTPSWAAAGGTDRDVWNDPPADLDAWARFVQTLAAEMRRHRNIVSYEIYNEENARQWWDGTPATYREVLRRAIAAIKAGNPDAQLLLGGMVYPDTQWLDAICDGDGSGRQVDVIPFHAYPETWEDVPAESYLGPSFESGFVASADEACGRKPLWINEVGYATTPGRTESEQAEWWARAIATFAAEPRIEHIGIYEIKDAPRDKPVIGDAPNYHLGLADPQRRKKLAFKTIKLLVALLGTQPIAPATPRVGTPAGASLAPEVYRHLFIGADGQRVLFLWTRTADASIDVQLGGAAREVVEYGIDGTRSGQRPVRDGWLRAVALRRGVVRIFATRSDPAS